MSTLDDMIERLQSLPHELTVEACPRVAAALKRELTQSIAAGKSADGPAWDAKQDGGQPLKNAAAAISTSVYGTRVRISIKGIEARHHRGRVKGGVARPILPTRGLPAAWSAAIERELSECFQEWSGTRG